MAKVENKTYRHIWSVLCLYSVLDQESNNLSLFNLVEKLTFTPPKNQITEIEKQKKIGKLVVPVNFELVTRIKKNTDKAISVDIEVVIIDPQKVEIGKFLKRVDFRKEIKNMRYRNRFNSLPITINGEYEILVNIKDQDEKEFTQVANIPLEVELKMD
ncbi:MAG: hypothetical protein A3G49_01275 [Candidatus Sungbacteria bacterium RIFCSPLOWO2_12_FULL_41_11]|uniref:Uncharacterized protein n=1 Tax=Candidatus Sungbacteria bacterium RIFCSPLOWO2_12_FULL_41_11 TaxID=1802286 RepID=A0A1G2LNT0_9BACT|nr:MAG: hypothetical protein UV01_C0006G0012 [Parcubacteria group bacterium GW2011_GWA2_42_14]OGZ97387.1 MAG: hypothetical protein A3D41_05460 [Candidatus Sungbacteria bacterium RIFCSPHIGHO2_02_FULL_41_12b]OHA13265.1 MAG: hypothetical protein A3G49_01275 [Candidatus Sungbacteria bacterium RIFCSPLOWO2_12_FULL_41_11]